MINEGVGFCDIVAFKRIFQPLLVLLDLGFLIPDVFDGTKVAGH